MKRKVNDERFRISTKIKYADDHVFRDKIAFSDNELKAQFIVDEKEKTTVCILTDTNLMNMYNYIREMIVRYSLPMCKKYLLTDVNPDQIKVKTKCLPEDTFDRTEGMKIALAKAKRVRFAIIKEMITAFQDRVYVNFNYEFKMLEKRVENIDKIVAKMEKKKAKKIANTKKMNSMKSDTVYVEN